jgi:hypothetical protein
LRKRKESNVGTITNDMQRLRDEIGASRVVRKDFMKKDVANTLNAVHKALVGLRSGVEHTLAGFRASRRKMTKQTAKERGVFMADLQEKVLGLRNDVVNLRSMTVKDLAGARAAFFGTAAPRREARKTASRRSRSRS